MSVEYLEHTADIRMKVTEVSLEALFEAAVVGMNDIMKENFCKQTNDYVIHYDINITSADRTNLLIDFLSEVLSYNYIEKALFCKVTIHTLSEERIVATISGAVIDQFEEEIKAVTYHEAEVKRNALQRWETTIVFDI